MNKRKLERRIRIRESIAEQIRNPDNWMPNLSRIAKHARAPVSTTHDQLKPIRQSQIERKKKRFKGGTMIMITI